MPLKHMVVWTHNLKKVVLLLKDLKKQQIVRLIYDAIE
jgi:hypothetical protein